MADFDVALVAAAHAAEMAREFTALKRRFEVAELACTKRVADAGLVRTRGDHDGAKATGRRLGVTHGQAAQMLALADQLHRLPSTREAFEAGRISKEQAAEVARTASVRPQAEADLLRVAQHESLGELKRRAQKIRATGEDGEAKLRRLHRQRYLRTWTDSEGSGCGRWSLPGHLHAELMAALAPWREQIFSDSRRAGLREAPEAYDADALIELARDAAAFAALDRDDADEGGAPIGGDAADRAGTGAGDDAADGAGTPIGGDAADRVSKPNEGDAARRPRSNRSDRRRPTGRTQTKVIVRVDWAALRRGHPEGDEMCDIAGLGPIPVAVVRELLADDPFVAAVLTEGTDVRSVTHFGRRATALMRTALEWTDQGCAVLGCPNQARLEIDHTEEWARTRHTRLDELDLLCRHHHRQKTHDGYRLEPGRGTRRFLSPAEQAVGPSGEGRSPPGFAA